jgi:hypothetical protein
MSWVTPEEFAADMEALDATDLRERATHDEGTDTYTVPMRFAGPIFREMFAGNWSPPLRMRLEVDNDGYGLIVTGGDSEVNE